jgi:hypothetical protein
MRDSRANLNNTELEPAQITKHLAYGEAAVMWLECLMLVLIEQRVLTHQQMVDAVESAIATKRQMVHEGEQPTVSAAAAGLLSTLANSLAAGGPTSPLRLPLRAGSWPCPPCAQPAP